MKKKRILLILPRGASGTGSGTYSGILVDALRKIDELDIRVYTSPADLAENPDLVHAVDLKHLDPGIVASIKAPLVLDVHDVYWLPGEQRFPSPDMPVRLYLAAKRRRHYTPLLDRAAAVIAHSEYVAARLPNSNAHIISYPIEPLKPGPALPERPPQILFAGRDYFRKGLPVLINAWKHVCKVRPDATLLIAGREFMHGRLYAKAASLRGSVKWLGDCPRDKLLDEIRSSRALVLPSWTEAFGIVFIEAAASGTPTIGTRVGGIPEALDEGNCGILIEKGAGHELARSILRCLEPEPDSELVDMANRARSRSESYSVENMVKNLLVLYDGIKGG